MGCPGFCRGALSHARPGGERLGRSDPGIFGLLQIGHRSMQQCSGHTTQTALAWISSLLVHAAILLVICWWAAIPHLLPPGQAAVEVSLVGAIPGGEGAPGNAETAARRGHAPLGAGDRQAGASSPAAPRSAAVTSAPPPPGGRQTDGKAEGPRSAIAPPSVMDRVVAQEAADVPLALETTGARP